MRSVSFLTCSRLLLIAIVFDNTNAKPGFAQTSDRVPEGALDKKSADVSELRIRIVDAQGDTVPYAEVQVWGEESHPTQMQPVMTDMSGDVVVEIADFLTARMGITARVDNPDSPMAGLVEVAGSSFDLDNTCEIKVAPTREIAGFVVDYDTGNPIEGCDVKVLLVGPQGISVDPGIKLVTTADGKFEVAGIIAGMYVRIDATCEGYHHFEGPAPAVDYAQRENNGHKSPPKLALICESSYLRAFDAARLSIPDVSYMDSAKALDTLIQNYEQTELRTKEARHYADSLGQVHGLIAYLRSFPKALYRDAIWNLAGTSDDKDVQLQGLIWLLENVEYHSPPVSSVESAKVAERLVERFASHQNIGDVASSIRSFHPSPQAALEQILSENPVHEVQAAALEQLVYLTSTSSYSYSNHPNPTDIEARQTKQRRYLNLIVEKYGDLPQGLQNESMKEFAVKRLAWLDTYGIGGTPPDLAGETVAGDETVSLNDFRGRVVVLHFWVSYQVPEFEDLKLIANRHKNDVQIVGVANGERDSAKVALARNQPGWPIIWDSNQGWIMKRGITREDPSGLMWGGAKASQFKWFSTIVLDSSGKIRAAGLTGDELQSFVAKLVADEQD